MPKLIILKASPKKKSTSLDAAIILASVLKIKPEIIDINRFNIKPCTACNKCEKTFKCVIKDDVEMLLQKIGKADIVIAASPVYFTGVPGPFKTFIDRNQPVFWSGKQRIANSERRISQGYIILTAGDTTDKHFLPAKREIASMFRVHNIKVKGVVKIGGTDSIKDVTKHAPSIRKIKNVVIKKKAK